MDSTCASTLNNGTRFSPNVSNNSFGFSKYPPNVNTDFINIALYTLYSLGLPDNLLVIAVYVRHMTSSLIIYLFALAIANSVICVVIFNKLASLYALNVVVFVAMFLLVFLPIERLTAILRPHSFNTNPRRAWRALHIIAAATVEELLMRELRLEFI